MSILSNVVVTKFTAEKDPTIINLLGVQGDQNRRKLAETFKRPTTWQQYCEEVSPSNCTVADDVAQRAPMNEVENDRMHVSSLYTGYFRDTPENDCDLKPDTCTGHIGDYPCGWTSNTEPQIYHLGWPLQSSGNQPNSRG